MCFGRLDFLGAIDALVGAFLVPGPQRFDGQGGLAPDLTALLCSPGRPRCRTSCLQLLSGFINQADRLGGPCGASWHIV